MWTPELISCLNNEFTDLYIDKRNKPWFEIVDYDKHINVPAGELKYITIRFTPQDEEKSRPASALSTKTSRTKPRHIKSEVAVKRGNSPMKGGAPSINSEKAGGKDSTPSNSKAIKSRKKSNRGFAERKGKQKTAPSVKFIASKFTVLLADIKEVKEWLVLGVIKK